MTRDQAQKIAEAIFDAAEDAGHLSKDLVVDAIFNSWHKQTADTHKSKLATYAVVDSEGLYLCTNPEEAWIVAKALYHELKPTYDANPVKQISPSESVTCYMRNAT